MLLFRQPHHHFGEHSANNHGDAHHTHKLPRVVLDIFKKMKMPHSRANSSKSQLDSKPPDRPQMVKRHTINRAVDKVTTTLRRVKTSANLKLHHHSHSGAGPSHIPKIVPRHDAQISTSQPCTSNHQITTRQSRALLAELYAVRDSRSQLWCNNQRKLEGACNYHCGTCDWQSLPVFEEDELDPNSSVLDPTYQDQIRPLQPRSRFTTTQIAPILQESRPSTPPKECDESIDKASYTASTGTTSTKNSFHHWTGGAAMESISFPVRPRRISQSA